MTHTHHTIDYIELNVVDLEASKTFYEQAFGWQFNEYGPVYAGIRHPSGEGEVGGLN
ncbi:MAG TPA: VOC family protein, partial [Nocardioides sp.]|nr:VOC family protein [Nocardioides sp.]